MVIDGGEIYAIRTQAEFDTSYAWRKIGIASSQTNCFFIPPALRPTWQSDVSISFGIYDRSDPVGGAMNTTIWQATIEHSLKRCDHLIWPYLEGVNMLKSNTNEDWAQATRLGKAAALQSRPTQVVNDPNKIRIEGGRRFSFINRTDGLTAAINSAGRYVVQVYSLDGTCVMRREGSAPAAYQFDRRTLRPGTYVATIQAAGIQQQSTITLTY